MENGKIRFTAFYFVVSTIFYRYNILPSLTIFFAMSHSRGVTVIPTGCRNLFMLPAGSYPFSPRITEKKQIKSVSITRSYNGACTRKNKNSETTMVFTGYFLARKTDPWTHESTHTFRDNFRGIFGCKLRLNFAKSSATLGCSGLLLRAKEGNRKRAIVNETCTQKQWLLYKKTPFVFLLACSVCPLQKGSKHTHNIFSVSRSNLIRKPAPTIWELKMTP